MNINKCRSAILTTLALFTCMFVVPIASSAEMTPASQVFDDATYTAEVEKAHQKLHALYGKAVNKSLSKSQREKARRGYFETSQDINKKMHSRVMMLDPKMGAALSHTDILLSTHLLLMTTDMLSTMQQEGWDEDSRISN